MKKEGRPNSMLLMTILCGMSLIHLFGYSQKLTVVIKNVKNDKGKAGAALYDSKDHFMKETFRTASAAATKGDVSVVFEKVPAGDYAISILHDMNDDGKMDTNAVGIPKEGYGFSNDVMGTFGPPSFEKAKIVVTGKDQTVVINMKYF